MWPWAHAALGYLLYRLWFRVRGPIDRSAPGTAPATPGGVAVLALALGTQLPDLIDKPLAWYLDVLPFGRTFAHSLVLGGVVVALIVVSLRRRGHAEVSTAFSIGYCSHLLGDAYQLVLTREWGDLVFLVWPLFPIPSVDREVEGILAHLRNVEAEPFFVFGLLLTALGLAVWIRDGTPGIGTLVRWVRDRGTPI